MEFDLDMEAEPARSTDVVDTRGSEVPSTNSQISAKGKKLKSDVWENMTLFIMPDNSIDAKCNHRKKRFKAGPSNGTHSCFIIGSRVENEEDSDSIEVCD